MSTSLRSRKGYSRRSDIPPDLLAALNTGEEATATLAEVLAIDFAVLLGAVVPTLPSSVGARMQAAAGEGVSRRMASGALTSMR